VKNIPGWRASLLKCWQEIPAEHAVKLLEARSSFPAICLQQSYLEANRASNLRLSERFISYPAACWVLKFTFKNGGSGRLQEDSHHIHIILPDRTVPPWISMISRVTNTLAPFWQRVCREKHPVAQILKAPDASFPN
jgi:hypothetical protein